MRITLVEDNAALALGIRNALDDHGHAVNWLADGTEADQFLTRETADLIIMDVNLPGLSGFDLVRLLRRRGTMTPVIMLTARSELVDRVMGLDAGADDYLVKPFDMS
jgi:two-component system OmpR family response regulator